MPINVDIVMQGPIYGETLLYAQSYLECPHVNQVIISTWEGQPTVEASERIKVIYSKDLDNPGMGNRNRHIAGTCYGLECVTTPIVIKSRTDQHLRGHSLETMYNYFLSNYEMPFKFVDGSGPKGAIFAVGLYTQFVFHPQDHLFMGWVEDIRALYSIPLDSKIPVNINNPQDNSGAFADWAHTDTRPNTYLGMFYYAKFDTRIQQMIQDVPRFIVDEAPEREEALALDRKYRDTILKAFPTLDIWWTKYGRDYPYDWGVPFTEYHA